MSAAAFTFFDVMFMLIFILILWIAGKLANKVGLPSLVGEIICGVIFGPNLINMAPKPDALMLLGEVGLMLLVIEAGLDVNVSILKIIGLRGAAVAVFGSVVPLSIGYFIASALGLSVKSSLVVGATLAPTSMGIALSVLRGAKVLGTPTGQLIIAAAILDDVIALILLSEIQALEHPSVWGFAQPILVAVAFLGVFGAVAVKVMPVVVTRFLLPRFDPKYHDMVVLALVFLLAFLLVPGCKFAGSSSLLGCFLAGLCLCTSSRVHHAWVRQVKRLLQWMLKLFFACTIGFEVPLLELLRGPVLVRGLLFTLPIVGKLATAVFAKPLNKWEGGTIAFAMSAWGEFAFIIAVYAVDHGVISRETFSSLTLAVLLSVILSPLLLRQVLVRRQRALLLQQAGAAACDAQGNTEASDTQQSQRCGVGGGGGGGGGGSGGGVDEEHPLIIVLHAKARGSRRVGGRHWMQPQVLAVCEDLELTLLDLRLFPALPGVEHASCGLLRIIAADPSVQVTAADLQILNRSAAAAAAAEAQAGGGAAAAVAEEEEEAAAAHHRVREHLQAVHDQFQTALGGAHKAQVHVGRWQMQPGPSPSSVSLSPQRRMLKRRYDAQLALLKRQFHLAAPEPPSSAPATIPLHPAHARAHAHSGDGSSSSGSALHTPHTHREAAPPHAAASALLPSSAPSCRPSTPSSASEISSDLDSDLDSGSRSDSDSGGDGSSRHTPLAESKAAAAAGAGAAAASAGGGSGGSGGADPAHTARFFSFAPSHGQQAHHRAHARSHEARVSEYLAQGGSVVWEHFNTPVSSASANGHHHRRRKHRNALRRVPHRGRWL